MKRAKMTRAGAAIGIVLACAACGGGAKAPEVDRRAPHWEDAFDRVPEIVVVARPRALGRDRTYGPLLKALSRVAAARGVASAGGERALAALESSEEVLFALGAVRGAAADDMTIVVRGVRADFDATKLHDDHGGTFWGHARSTALSPVQELVHEPSVGDREARRGDPPASLFVLPERTWVVAAGPARDRAREAFAHPFGRPAPVKDTSALLLVRLDGKSLVEAVPRLRRGALEALGRKLDSLTVALLPSPEGLQARLAYRDEDAAAWAELTLRQVVEALGREGGEKLAWLGIAKVERDPTDARAVTARVTLPPSLLDRLASVTGDDLAF
jgi:hypothetical protein